MDQFSFRISWPTPLTSLVGEDESPYPRRRFRLCPYKPTTSLRERRQVEIEGDILHFCPYRRKNCFSKTITNSLRNCHVSLSTMTSLHGVLVCSVPYRPTTDETIDYHVDPQDKPGLVVWTSVWEEGRSDCQRFNSFTTVGHPCPGVERRGPDGTTYLSE